MNYRFTITLILLIFSADYADAKDIKFSVSTKKLEKIIPAVYKEVRLLPKKVGNQMYCFEIVYIEEKSSFRNLELEKNDCLISLMTESAFVINGKTDVSQQTILFNTPDSLIDLPQKIVGIRMAIIKFNRNNKLHEQKYLLNYTN